MFRTTQIAWAMIALIITVTTILSATVDAEYIRIVGLSGVGFLLLTFQLTITVDDQWVRVTMGVGLIHAKFPIDRVTDCRIVRCFPVGYGLIAGNRTVIYSVSSCKAVEISIAGKRRKVWLGTNNHHTLERFIWEMKRRQMVKNNVARELCSVE